MNSNVQSLIHLVLCVIGLLGLTSCAPRQNHPLRFRGESGQFDLMPPSLNHITAQSPTATNVVTLVAAGRAGAVIVCDQKNAPARAAAEDLAEHVRLATGVTLPILGDDQPRTGPVILVGESRQTKEQGIRSDDLPPEGFRVQSFAGGVAIVGPGTAHGVCDFLERFVGVRWYYPGEDGTYVPRLENLKVPPVHYTDHPRTGLRNMWPWQAQGLGPETPPGTSWYDLPFARALWRHYRQSQRIPGVPCHTLPNWNVHKKEFPETLELLGAQRNDHTPVGGMPCFGNPQTLKVLLADIEAFDRHEDRPYPWKLDNGTLCAPPTPTAIYFSPPDKEVDCQCKFCEALRVPDGGRWGASSRIVGTFVANLAREVKTRWPERTVIYLPYQNYTEPLAGIEFPGNVYVGICLMNGAGNMRDPAVRATYDRWISGWRKLTGRQVQLWEYQCWPGTTFPFQMPHLLQDFYRAHRDDRTGSFINGAGNPATIPGQQWAFQHPTLYCWFRLLWNPDFDVDAALEEYVRLMYGPSQAPMRKILRLLTDRWEKTDWKVAADCEWTVPAQRLHEVIMPKAQEEVLRGWLAEARRRAPADSVYRRRVDFLGRAIDLFLIEAAVYRKEYPFPDARMTAKKTAMTPACDGKLDEPCWQTAASQPLVLGLIALDSKPGAESRVQAVWTDTGVAFAFSLSEPYMHKLVANITRPELVYVGSDDSVEILLDCQSQPARYLHATVNCLGVNRTTVTDGPDMRHPTYFTMPTIQAGAARGRDGWTVEVFVPFAAFDTKLKPVAGNEWKVNFVRSRRTVETGELQRWSTRFAASNHDPEAFGSLKFGE